MKNNRTSNVGLKIGHVANRTGLTVDAIRFYEREGLLPERRRTEAGYRIFDDSDVEALTFIGRAQELGFSLREIRELLVLRGDALHACGEVQTLLERKLVAVREKMRDLSALENNLQSALRKCRRELQRGGPKHPECCPVLEEIQVDVDHSQMKAGPRNGRSWPRAKRRR